MVEKFKKVGYVKIYLKGPHMRGVPDRDVYYNIWKEGSSYSVTIDRKLHKTSKVNVEILIHHQLYRLASGIKYAKENPEGAEVLEIKVPKKIIELAEQELFLREI